MTLRGSQNVEHALGHVTTDAQRSLFLRQRVRTYFERALTRSRAIWLALGVTALAAFADFATGADTAFTLFYVLPLATSVWFVNLRMGYVIIAVSMAASVSVDLFATHRPLNWYFVIWNNAGEAATFVLIAHLFAILREHVANEVKLRVEAMDQLRHSERLTTVGKLAAGLAHELGTPLNVINGHAEMIGSGLSPDDLRRSVEVIRSQVSRITRVVRQLLDLSRNDADGPEKTDLRQLLAEALELFEPLAAKKRIRLELSGEPVEATVNGAEIQQVIANLVTNAIHAMPDGGTIHVTTSLASEPRRGRANAATFAHITVRDEGSGIAPDVLPKIFDPFFTTKEAGEGTGLGLSVSHGIVSDHGGYISVDSQQGSGTSFHVYLPM